MHITPRQRAYIKKKTKFEEADPSETAGELNIVPFLDIVVNLIMFLLMTTATILAIAQIEAHLPGLGARGAATAGRDGLNLSVTLTDRGIVVAGSSGKLALGCNSVGSGNVITVPTITARSTDPLENGRKTYDFAALTACVANVKAHPEFAEEHQVIVGADPMIPYIDVVQAMDAVRARGPEELFPDVLLSAGVR